MPIQKFSPDILSELIKSYLNNANNFEVVDEELASVLRNAYVADPVLLINTLADFDFQEATVLTGLLARHVEKNHIEISEIPQDKLSSNQYYVKVYSLSDGTEYLKSAHNVTLEANNYLSLSLIPYSISNLQIKAEIYSAENETLLATGSTQIAAVGDWKIVVQLPSNRNYKGTLYLYDGLANYKFSCECLGRSDSGASMTTYEGNTPTGTYDAWIGGVKSPEYSYGPYAVIETTPLSGIVVEAGRSGIWVHGGAPSTNPSASYYPLRPTYGCVRVANDRQYVLLNQITHLINGGHDPYGGMIINQV